MKTIIPHLISMTILLTVMNPSFSQERQKLYTVTDEGEYYFTYWEQMTAPKAGNHPVTVRTFYLEAYRQGFIPGGMTYGAFLSLRTDEKQAIINSSMEQLIAALQKQDEPGQAESVSVNEQAASADENVAMRETEEATAIAEDQPDNGDIPWVVKAVTNPGEEFRMGYAAPEYAETESAEDDYTGFAPEDGKKTIPWIVALMTSHPAYDLYYEDEESGTAATSENREMKVALLALLDELIIFQDEETRQKYGRIFAGAEGKLYGSSDAELDELIMALLQMKDEIILSSHHEELGEIFATLQALVSM